MMVREEKALSEFERQDAARLDRVLTPQKALRLYDAMWECVKASGALQRKDPLEGLEIASEVARMVNSLSGGEPPARPLSRDTATDEPPARPYPRQRNV
jgi:hypothetical protein